jgi:hypothetical protein
MASNPNESVLHKIIDELKSVPPVQERVRLFRKLIHKVVDDPVSDPGIPNVIFQNDWSEDEAIQTKDFEFIRQILEASKLEYRQEWNYVLQTCTPRQAELLQRFTDGGALDELVDLFDFDSTRGSREEFLKMEGSLAEPHEELHMDSLQTQNLAFFKKPFSLGLYNDEKNKNPIAVSYRQ